MTRKENPTSPFDSSPDAEATIAKLQQHDDMVSEKIIKSLSTLKEPPESVNLGGSESRKLIRNGLEEEDRGASFLHQPFPNNRESLLDPVKAQERAEELKVKVEREKELQNAVDRSEKETHHVALKTEEALNALDGKPLAKISDISPELKLSTDKKVKESDGKPQSTKEVETTETKHEEIKKQESPPVTEKKEITSSEKTSDEEKKIITTNQIQNPKENSTIDKPIEESSNKIAANDTQSQTKNTVLVPPQKDKIIAENATVSTQVVDVLKGIGQIKESPPKTVLNKTLDNEEKETKEAVNDLNVAIGILEKKLSLINQAKSTGDKKNIYLVDGENKKQDKDDVAAASRSQIELDNSLKLLEKVMSVAKRVGKPKPKSEVVAVTSPSNLSEKRKTNTQRSRIQPSIDRQHKPIALNVQENARYFQQQPSEVEEYDLLDEDENNKRASIYRYPVVDDSFIIQVKRNKIPFKSLNLQKQRYTRYNSDKNNNNNWNYRKSAITGPFYPYNSYYNRPYYYQQLWSQYPRY